MRGAKPQRLLSGLYRSMDAGRTWKWMSTIDTFTPLKAAGAGAVPIDGETAALLRYADASRSRSLGGTGLGLAIVKHIIERHRGRFDISSRLGQGTTASITLPLSGA